MPTEEFEKSIGGRPFPFHIKAGGEMDSGSWEEVYLNETIDIPYLASHKERENAQNMEGRTSLSDRGWNDSGAL